MTRQSTAARMKLHYLVANASGPADLDDVAHLLSPTTINARDDRGATAFAIAAATTGSIRLLERLVQLGADTATVDNSSNTPVHACAMHNHHPAVLSWLLEVSGTSPDTPGHRGWRPLHFWAAFNQVAEIGRVLIRADGNPDAPIEAREAWTPLHVGAQWTGNPETIAILLKHGASPDRLDCYGRTAWDLAQHNPKVLNSPGWWLLRDGAQTDYSLRSFGAQHVRKNTS